MQDQQAQGAVWARHSSQWQRIGSPLRPLPQDAARALALLMPALSREEARQVVVLGVTPELVQADWPERVNLLAVDHSAPMIASLWKPNARIASGVLQARWQDLPLPDRTVAAIAGDGSLNALPHADDIRSVFAEMARVLSPGGLMALRCYLRPETQESLDAVRDAALQGGIGSFHALKWRIAMALPIGPDCGVAVAAILDAFERLFPEREELAQWAGWPREIIDTIEAYRGNDTRYCFPTLPQLSAMATPHFRIAGQRHGDYELAERCPTLCFRSSMS